MSPSTFEHFCVFILSTHSNKHSTFIHIFIHSWCASYLYDTIRPHMGSLTRTMTHGVTDTTQQSMLISLSGFTARLILLDLHECWKCAARKRREEETKRKAAKGKPSIYLCGIDNSRIFTVNIWDKGLLFHLETNKLAASKLQLLQPGMCGPVCNTSFPPQVFASVGREMTRGTLTFTHQRLRDFQAHSVWKSDSSLNISIGIAQKIVSRPNVKMLHVWADRGVSFWNLDVLTDKRWRQ